MTRRLLPAVLAASALLVPGKATAQTRWRSVGLQAGLAVGSTDFGGLGISASAELGVFRSLRVYGQWADWQALASCALLDAPSECNVPGQFVEVGLRQGLGLSPKVAPFAGLGVGLYLRGYRQGTHPFVSIAAGLDISVRRPVAIRVSATYQQVLSKELRELYGQDVRFVGLQVGLDIAVW